MFYPLREAEGIRRLLEQNDIEALKLAGLSLNQAKVYLALLSTGRSTIKVISKVSEIDRANTSRSIASLEKFALVKKTLAMPNVYEPISIEDAIDVLLKEKSEEYTQIQNTTKALLDKFQKLTPNKTPAEDEFTMIPGKNACVKLSLSLWRSAKHTIDIVSSARSVMTSNNVFITEMKRALERGVTVRSIQDLKLGNMDVSIPPRKVARSRLFSKPQWDERYSINSAIVGAIFDKKVCTFVTNPTSTFSKSPSLVTNNKCFIEILQYYFEGLWSSAKPSGANAKMKMLLEQQDALVSLEA